MIISMIVAADANNGIGLDNKLPWRLPEDTAYFKRTTSGHTVLMGRKTYESIGRPLPKRRNVILTRNREFRADGCEIVYSVEEALERFRAEADGELFVIGGSEIYGLFMPYADRLYVTEIAHRFEADAFFPEIDSSQWRMASKKKGVKNEQNPYDYDFVVYERRR